MKTGKTNSHILPYVIYTYGLFILLLLIFGGLATTLLGGTPSVMRWVTVITAWTPTYVFLLMFKRLYPNSTIREFYKKSFFDKLNIRLLTVTTLIQMLIFISGVYLISIQKSITAISLLDLSFLTIMLALFFTLIQGATGEETGWRGYLLPEIEKKFGVIKGIFIVSLIWSFWHTPIWFLNTEYTGMLLLKYIVVFVICITSLGIIIGICYYLCKNLLVPIWIHFIFNFLGEMFKGNLIDLVTWYAVFYFIMAMVFLILFKVGFNFLDTKR